MIAIREWYGVNDDAKNFQVAKDLSDEQLQIYIGLMNQRDPLPSEVKDEIKNIINSNSADSEKDDLVVNILVKWVKENIK